MKKIMERYNHAFSYVKGYFVLSGVMALGIVIAGILCIIQRVAPFKEIFLGMIIPAMVVVLIATIIVLTTRTKCPPDKRGLLGLILNMSIVGIAATFL